MILQNIVFITQILNYHHKLDTENTLFPKALFYKPLE